MATEAQLIARTLGQLRAVGTGQPPNAEDAAVVQAYIPEKLADLAQREIIYIPDSESVPDGVLIWVAMAIAQDLAEDFGSTFDERKKKLAEDMLIRSRPATPAKRLRVDYF